MTEIIALISLFVFSTGFMCFVTFCQYRLEGRIDELQDEKKAMRDELTCLRERLKKLEIERDDKKSGDI